MLPEMSRARSSSRSSIVADQRRGTGFSGPPLGGVGLAGYIGGRRHDWPNETQIRVKVEARRAVYELGSEQQKPVKPLALNKDNRGA